MKPLIITLVSLLAVLPSYAQDDEFDYTINEKVLGKNLVTNTNIVGKEYNFNGGIYKTQLDTGKKQILFLLDRGGEKYPTILLFDFTSERIMWTKDGIIGTKYINDLFIENYTRGSICFNRNDGEKRWQTSNKLFYFDTAFAFGVNSAKRMVAVDLNTGKTKWERKVNNNLGWNGIWHVDDDTYVFAADGLYSINIDDGSGWKFDMQTATTDERKRVKIESSTTGIIYGYKGADVYNACSQLIYEKPRMYFASARNLACIDIEGEKIWEDALPDSLMSASVLYKPAQNIYLLNKGYTISDNQKTFVGTPFIASYDKETGKENYLRAIETRSHLQDWLFIKDTLLLLFADTIYKYQLNNGELLACKNVSDSGSETFNTICTPNIFFTGSLDSDYKRISEQDPGAYTITNSSWEVLQFSNDLKNTFFLSAGKFWLNYGGNHVSDFLWNGKQVIVVRHGRKIAELDVSSKSILVGKKLYDVQKDRMNVIDLSDVL